MADVDRIDADGKTVSLDSGTVQLTFDYLVLASRCPSCLLRHPEWEQHAPGLKSIEDALEMRRRFLLSFEAAERASAAGERDALLTFVIVGGGPTGVELAGMIPKSRTTRSRASSGASIRARARVLLLEGGPRILPAFPEELSQQAQRDLERSA
jgi:NADH:ubiquinone reductase (H+-translocating)